MSHMIASHLTTLHADSKNRLKALERSTNFSFNISPIYAVRPAATKAEEPSIPDPSLFGGITPNTSQTPGPAGPSSGSASRPDSNRVSDNGDSDVLALPSVAECAVHLEMLEVFFALRSRVIGSAQLDKAFGFESKPKTVYRREYDYKQRKYVKKPHKIKDSTWKTRRRDKWIVYLHIAVGRFMAWARAADADLLLASQQDLTIELPHLPPCEVLMVWHAFLLNPEDYKEYCNKQKLQWLYKVPFPWRRVHEAIDHRALSYTLPRECRHWTTAQARLAPDLEEFFVQTSNKEGFISHGLSIYGTLHMRDIWTKRPVFDLTKVSEPAAQIERGFVDAFQEASRHAAQAKLLVANVQRQASFVDKMHRHLWLRSPPAAGTLRRAIDRYDGFLQLFKLHPWCTLVPTLDVDLAWHTHQLSPLQYIAAVEARAGRFINHDDKIVQGRLNVGMDKTKELFQERFGERYNVCLCWDCEALVDALEKADEDDVLDTGDMQTWVQEAQKEVEYYRTVELARRRGGSGLLPVLYETEEVVAGVECQR